LAIFFAKRVNKPTDNRRARCFATATDASSSVLQRLWRQVVVGPARVIPRWDQRLLRGRPVAIDGPEHSHALGNRIGRDFFRRAAGRHPGCIGKIATSVGALFRGCVGEISIFVSMVWYPRQQWRNGLLLHQLEAMSYDKFGARRQLCPEPLLSAVTAVPAAAHHRAPKVEHA
jgi:hypothetical protein